MRKNKFEISKKENLNIDLFAYQGSHTSSPHKGIYQKDEITAAVSNIIESGYINIDDFDVECFEIMNSVDDYDNLKAELTNRIYEALNDIYNPYKDKAYTIRKGLDMRKDSLDILMDIDTYYTQEIFKNHRTELLGELLDEDMDEDDIENEIVSRVVVVISDLYYKILDVLYI